MLADRAFAASRTICLSFADGNDDASRLRIVRARFDGAPLHDVQTIFTAQPDKRGAAHFGGRLVQLNDGTLVASVGDGFVHREAAQDAASHFGKLVRFASDGSCRADNPIAGSLIYSLGHRNPQGLAFDPRDGVLYEHGPRGGDELNRIEAGANYGWPLATHGLDYASARGALFPSWQERLFVAALVDKSVRRVSLRDRTQETLFTEIGQRIRDVRTAPDGSLYLLTDSGAGHVLRVSPE